ncbi:MAG: carbon-monoxide dehydrogenase catalytic subunit [Deltaproteobacteria bacterium RBG_13_61_14]|nr:MAG: carbon-monoxide dehydrogenase catalytic subunit [Deltaproteobacteria bacterium RBG_13_61_14]
MPERRAEVDSTRRYPEMTEPKRSADPTVGPLLEKAKQDGAETAFDRAMEGQKAICQYGANGVCCRLCAMGPCRISLKEGKGAERGVCGATANTIAARNFCRMIAAGAAAHSDHARAVADTFILAAKGEIPGFQIKDEQKLYQLALDLGIAIGDRSVKEIAIEVGEKCLAEFGRQEGELLLVKRAPLKRQEIWRKLGMTPRGIDREVVEMMHRTHMGVDQDYRNLILQGSRTSLADGWGGSMISTELQDIMFGTPQPIASEINLGVLKADEVNIIVHGHEPLLSEMVVVASRDPELLAFAKEKGAKGINLAGICCTANEILMRHGIPIAGNFLQQELAIVTGAVDAMVVDVQCIMENLAEISKCYHTKLITTNYRAKIIGAEHIQFEEHDAINTAKKIVRTAIENYPRRDPKKVSIPQEKSDMVVGFSHETINYLLGGLFRASYRPLNDNIINGRIRGIAGVVGCNNVRTEHDSAHLAMIKELLKNDVIVLTTGCAAMACGKAGLLTPEAAKQYCGPGLAEVCETVGIPPVLHMGACVDNSRILIAATAVVKEGGLGDDISDLPAAGAAPEWMSEKAIAIGQYFVASGVFTVFGVTFPIMGAPQVRDHLFSELEGMVGGKWAFEPDPVKGAKLMIEHIDKKRKALGIDKARERVLYDMAMRREME